MSHSSRYTPLMPGIYDPDPCGTHPPRVLGSHAIPFEVARIVANITVDVTTHDRVIRSTGGDAAKEKNWKDFIEGAVHTLSNTQSSDVQVHSAPWRP